jgi:hypothetical protein
MYKGCLYEQATFLFGMYYPESLSLLTFIRLIFINNIIKKSCFLFHF